MRLVCGHRLADADGRDLFTMCHIVGNRAALPLIIAQEWGLSKTVLFET